MTFEELKSENDSLRNINFEVTRKLSEQAVVIYDLEDRIKMCRDLFDDALGKIIKARGEHKL